MIIGVPKELKPDEYRVGLVPAGVKALSEEGHTVYIEAGAGEGSGISDREYEEAGAQILEDPDEVWARADLIIKVKEPIPVEYARLREGQILFTYLHLAPAPELTRELLARKVTGIAYETITDAEGRLPLLTPMSEVAGRMAVQVGATYLQKTHGGARRLARRCPRRAAGESRHPRRRRRRHQCHAHRRRHGRAGDRHG